MRSWSTNAALVLSIAVSMSCAKQEFLHHIKNEPVQMFNAEHKLKEIQGESRVDILWVIDNSASMMDHQNGLIANAETFINDFVSKGGLQWKMGVVSSAIAEPPYVGFTPSTLLTYTKPDNVKIFKDSVRRLGVNGDSMERFFDVVERQLTTFPSFVRKEGSLAVIFLTDTYDHSTMKAPEFLKFLARQKGGDIRRVVSYGVFASTDFGCDRTDETWRYAGSGYEEVIKKTKGKVFKLCDDFGKNLADLGKDLVERIKRPYINLPDRPVISTIRVIHDGLDLAGGPEQDQGYWYYDYDLNRIVFHSLEFAPGDNESVTISYQIAE